MSVHGFCRHLLSVTRNEALELVGPDGLGRPLSDHGWRVDRHDGVRSPYFWVRAGDYIGAPVLWEGGACCAWEARTNALNRKLRDLGGER